MCGSVVDDGWSTDDRRDEIQGRVEVAHDALHNTPSLLPLPPQTEMGSEVVFEPIDEVC